MQLVSEVNGANLKPQNTQPQIILSQKQRTMLSEQLKTVKQDEKGDYEFVSLYLMAIFGKDILAISSFSGKPSNSNGKAYTALDPQKLGYVQSMY